MEFNVKPYSKDQIPQITKLLEECFKFKIKDKISAVRWKYAYTQFPRTLFYYGAWDNKGNLVSQYTNLENNLIYQSSVIKALTCFDMATVPQHRGKGLITQLSQKLYQDVRKSKFVLSFGFSNEQGIKVDKYANEYGYKIVGKFAKYIKSVFFSKPSDITFKEIGSFPDKYEAFSDNFIRIYKPVEYVKWRYIKRPAHSYKIYQIKSPQIPIGFIVVRLHDLRVDLLDIIGIPFTNYPEVISGVEQLLKNNRKAFIVINILDNISWHSMLSALGYKRQPDRSHNYLTVKIHKHTVRDSFLNAESWLLMGGDIW